MQPIRGSIRLFALLLLSACTDDGAPKDPDERPQKEDPPLLDLDGDLGEQTDNSCVDTVTCFADCTDYDCIDDCASDTNEEGALAALKLFDCAVEKECTHEDCVTNECEEQVYACAGFEPAQSYLTCGEVFDCFTDCDDEDCVEDCVQRASDEADAEQAYELLSCVAGSGCEDEACAIQACTDEISACAGATIDNGGGGSGGEGGEGICPEPSGPGVSHQGFIERDEVWKAEEGPHLVEAHVAVRGATLTIEPCAFVELAEGVHITVGESSGDAAKLIAKGDVVDDEIRIVTFTSASSDVYWGGISTWTTGKTELSYAHIERAGHEDGPGAGYPGALAAQGDANPERVIKNVSLKHVRIDGSAGLGLQALSSGGFTDDSEDVTIVNSGAQGARSGDVLTTFAAYLEPPAVHTLPIGSYEGNEEDAVLVRTPSYVRANETFYDRGVPYQMVNEFRMVPEQDGEELHLTIEPGVTMRFAGEGSAGSVTGLILGDDSGDRRVRVTANGTEEAPIVFTSGVKESGPGDWMGVYWEAAPPTGNLLSYVTIEYAGGESGTSGFGCGPGDNDSALTVFWEPTESFMSNCTIKDSAEGGIVSAWRANASGPNLSESNSFSGIDNGCAVSVHPDADGVCPDDGGEPSCY